MSRYFLAFKIGLSLAVAYYLPAFIPLIVIYWLSVGFLFWRGRRGLPLPGEAKVAAEYLGGYPGLAPPQTIWLTTQRAALASGGMRVPYEAMRKVRVLRRPEAEALAGAEGLALPPLSEGDLFLALLWRDAGGAERELLFRLPGGRGERELDRLRERIETLRLKAAERRRGAR